jgi:hypothetical protein
MFVALTFTPHKLQVNHTLLCLDMSSFISSSTVNPLAFARSLTILAVLDLTVSEYQPFSGMNNHGDPCL